MYEYLLQNEKVIELYKRNEKERNGRRRAAWDRINYK